MKQMSLFDNDEKSVLADADVWEVYIDGASRNNPGRAGAGIYLLKNKKPVGEYGYYLGIRTNNQAEYLSILLGLYLVNKKRQKHDRVKLISDSQLAIRQLQGQYRVKNLELKPLYELAQKLIKECKAELEHVLREQNEHADRLANVGIEDKVPMPENFKLFLQQHEISI